MAADSGDHPTVAGGLAAEKRDEGGAGRVPQMAEVLRRRLVNLMHRKGGKPVGKATGAAGGRVWWSDGCGTWSRRSRTPEDMVGGGGQHAVCREACHVVSRRVK